MHIREKEKGILRWHIFLPSVFLLLAPLLTSCLKSSLPVDSRRDQMLETSAKVMKVLSKTLNLSSDRIMLNLRLDQIGVNQENKLKLQSALSKELKMEIPYKVLAETNTVGSVIRYVAVKSNSEIKLKPHSSDKLLEPPKESDSKLKSEVSKDKKDASDTKEKKAQSKDSKAKVQTSNKQQTNKSAPKNTSTEENSNSTELESTDAKKKN